MMANILIFNYIAPTCACVPYRENKGSQLSVNQFFNIYLLDTQLVATISSIYLFTYKSIR